MSTITSVPPRKKKTAAKPPALTNADVAGLRARLAAGETPRVIVRAASAAVPAGTRGNIIRMGPASDGEFIVVRLGRDEVPFAPAELGMSARGLAATAAAKTASKSTAKSATKAPARKTAASRPAKAAKRTAAAKKATRKVTAAKAPATRSAATKAPTTKAAPAATKAAAAPPAPVAPDRAATKRASSRRAGGRGRSKQRGAAPLTVTVRFSDGAWTVEAQRGSRRLSRASALRPGAVKTFADVVDEPAIREAITEIVESGRAVVAERAEKLRAELEAAEASLREYEARRR